MRCTYCRPHVMQRTDSGSAEAPLSCGEIHRLVEHLARRHGLQKVRLTGGEPTARTDLLAIVAALAQIAELDDLTMSTNGLTLERLAGPLARSGLQRVNVSLDSLDRQRFRRLTGIDGLIRVIDGIDAAIDARLCPVKLNTVVLRDENDRELPELVGFAADRGLEIRFIELMPMGPLAPTWRQRFVPEREMRNRLSDRFVSEWAPIPQGSSASRSYRATLADGRRATIGFITAMSCSFCHACDRLRVTSDGSFYPCLMGEPAGNIMSALRPTFDPHEIDRRLLDGILRRDPVHPSEGAGIMTSIGG